eukprot:355623-Chlamydomonas_euryale.AAC.14
MPARGIASKALEGMLAPTKALPGLKCLILPLEISQLHEGVASLPTRQHAASDDQNNLPAWRIAADENDTASFRGFKGFRL